MGHHAHAGQRQLDIFHAVSTDFCSQASSCLQDPPWPVLQLSPLVSVSQKSHIIGIGRQYTYSQATLGAMGKPRWQPDLQLQLFQMPIHAKSALLLGCWDHPFD